MDCWRVRVLGYRDLWEWLPRTNGRVGRAPKVKMLNPPRHDPFFFFGWPCDLFIICNTQDHNAMQSNVMYILLNKGDFKYIVLLYACYNVMNRYIMYCNIYSMYSVLYCVHLYIIRYIKWNMQLLGFIYELITLHYKVLSPSIQTISITTNDNRLPIHNNKQQLSMILDSIFVLFLIR